MNASIWAAAAAALSALALAACAETEGPAERAGEQIDETAGEIQENAREAGDDLERGLNDAANETRDTVEDAGDAIESETDEAAPPPQ